MKKICMIIPSFNAKGGITTVVNGYKESVLNDNYDITFIETYCDKSKFNKCFKAVCAYLKFIKLMVYDKPSLVHLHSSFGASFYRKLLFIYTSYFFKVPIINHIHGAEFDDFYINASEYKKRLIKKTYDKCDKLIVLSDEWKKNINQIINNEKISVVENFSTIQQYKRKKNDTKYILFLGFLCERKGCFDIPKIISDLKNLNNNFRIILAGDGTKKDVDKLNQLIKNYNVENYFILPGWVRDDEKKALLEKSDVFFLPSYNEGMPMAILDAMGYGLPIISTNVGGISKLVINNLNGITLSAGDVEGFTKALAEVLSSETLIESMGKESYKRANEMFSLKKHLEKISFIYDSVLNKKVK